MLQHIIAGGLCVSSEFTLYSSCHRILYAIVLTASSTPSTPIHNHQKKNKFLLNVRSFGLLISPIYKPFHFWLETNKVFYIYDEHGKRTYI